MSTSQVTLEFLQSEGQLPASTPTSLPTASLDFSPFPQVPTHSPRIFLQLAQQNYFYGPVADKRAEGQCIYLFSDGAYFKG